MGVEETRKRLMGKFKAETDTHLLSIQNLLTELKKEPANEDHIKEIFRNAHTIRGGAHMMNLLEITSIAQQMETIFEAMRDDGFQLSTEANDLLFKATKNITTMIEAAVKGEKAVGLNVADVNKKLSQVLAL